MRILSQLKKENIYINSEIINSYDEQGHTKSSVISVNYKLDNYSLDAEIYLFHQGLDSNVRVTTSGLFKGVSLLNNIKLYSQQDFLKRILKINGNRHFVESKNKKLKNAISNNEKIKVIFNSDYWPFEYYIYLSSSNNGFKFNFDFEKYPNNFLIENLYKIISNIEVLILEIGRIAILSNRSLK